MLPESKFTYLGSKYEIYLQYSKSTHQIGDIGEIDPSTNISKNNTAPSGAKVRRS